MGRKCELKCVTVQVRDTSNGKIYTPEQWEKDPKLKAYIDRRVAENIARVSGGVLVDDDEDFEEEE